MTDEPWSVEFWDEINPNNGGGNEHFLTIERQDGEAYWNDTESWGLRGFVLEIDATNIVSSLKTAVLFTFNAVLGSRYNIEAALDPANPNSWSVVEEDIIGNGETIERFFKKASGVVPRYRVVEEDVSGI